MPSGMRLEFEKQEKKQTDSVRVDIDVSPIDAATEEIKKPLYEVASSHMARRTFIGNIYKKVIDPNLVGALSGHKEGSKAFSRYREISSLENYGFLGAFSV